MHDRNHKWGKMQNKISAGLILQSYDRYLCFSLHLFILLLQIKQVYSLMSLAKIGPICTMLLSGGTSAKMAGCLLRFE